MGAVGVFGKPSASHGMASGRWSSSRCRQPLASRAAAGAAELQEHTAKHTQRTVLKLLDRTPGVRHVLDMPCGAGAFTQRLLARRYAVVAADCLETRGVAGARFIQADMNRPLPWHDDSFDAVVCLDGIEHIERPFDFITECRRVLRPGGSLLISTPNISALRSRWRWLLTGFHNKGKVPLDETQPSPWHHINLLSFPRLRYMLHRSDLRISAISTNRIKAVSWLYAPLVPLAYCTTWRVFRAEVTDARRRRQNREILKQMYSRALLFGETMIVQAVCCK